MKKTTLLLLLKISLWPALVFCQSGLSWSPEIPVTGVATGSLSPRIVLLPDGSPGAVWGNASKIWFSKESGGVFSTPVQVGTGGITPGLYDFGGLDIAASATRIFVVFEKFDVGIFCARSDDGGATWQPPVTVFSVGPGQGATISSAAVDAAGNPMVSFLKQTSNETQANVQLVRSLDGGLTFTVSTDASAPAAGNFVCECCYQDIFPAGGDTIFTAFRANRNNTRDMWVSRSLDGGGTFDAACDADAQDWVASVCPFSGPRMARMAGDSLFVVWMSKPAAGLRVFGSTLSRGSMEKGWEFPFPGTSPASSFVQNHPDVAGQNDTLAVVWEESGFSGTGQDILCNFSTTGAAGLATGNILNLSAATGSQKFPQLTYRAGIFHLLYTDPAKGLIYRRGAVMPSTGTHEAVSKSTCPIYIDTLPLPADMDWSKAARVEVFDQSGRLLKSWGANPTGGILNISDLPAGVYLLKISGAAGKDLAVQRFFKK